MPVIDAQSVSKQFLLRHNASVELKVRLLGLLHPDRRQKTEEFWALRNVSLRIERGEAIGLVGRNGSGKSTFLKLIAAVHRPTSGRLLVARGSRISSMIELGVGFHPELTGRENVFLNAAIHGMNRAEIEAIYDEIVRYSGLEHFIDVPIKNYSSGMYMRLGFAIAANLKPDILLLDEIFAVGDADFQQRCTDTVHGFLRDGKTILFVSHAPVAIQSICRRVCVLEEGRLSFDGSVDKGLAFYDALLAQRHGALAEGAASDRALSESEPSEEEKREGDGWLFNFLRREGLQPSHYLLSVGSDDVPGTGGLLRFLDARHYWGLNQGIQTATAILSHQAGFHADRGQFYASDTFDLSTIPYPLDFAMADGLLPQLPFNGVARCIAAVVRRLKPSGRFYATWFENTDPSDFEPVVRPSGTTYSDRPPYHYSFDMIQRVCESVGAHVERVPDATNPRGEAILVISPKS